MRLVRAKRPLWISPFSLIVSFCCTIISVPLKYTIIVRKILSATFSLNFLAKKSLEVSVFFKTQENSACFYEDQVIPAACRVMSYPSLRADTDVKEAAIVSTFRHIMWVEAIQRTGTNQWNNTAFPCADVNFISFFLHTRKDIKDIFAPSGRRPSGSTDNY